LTRFSIYSYPPKSFGIKDSKQTEAQYKEWLYNNKRMLNKFDIFEAITARSVKNQTYKNYEWLIYTSKELPDEYLDELKKITDSIPNTKIIILEPGTSLKTHFNKYSKGKDPYITIRLDDDDGLNPNYLQLLSKHTSPGLIISPKQGLLVSRTAPHGHFVSSYHSIFPRCGAWGLALTGGNVYSLGNHMNLHKDYKVVYLDEPDLYLLSSIAKEFRSSGFTRSQVIKPIPFDVDLFFSK
jgi:hypothetical protein